MLPHLMHHPANPRLCDQHVNVVGINLKTVQHNVPLIFLSGIITTIKH